MRDETGAGALVVDRLSVRYPGCEPVLQDVSFELERGASLLVVGASGSGKSTLVAALAGVVPHTVDAQVRGSVTLGHDGAWLGGPRSLAPHLGLVQQDPWAQLCLGTVSAEVELALENRAWPVEAIPRAVASALDRAGAGDLAARRTGRLSGGQAQRVATAAAIAPDPGVLVLDEPTALLDPVAAREVGRLVGRLGAGATTTVVVEHRLDDLVPLPQYTAVIAKGRLAAFGPTTTVMAKHADALLRTGCWVPTRWLLEVAGAPAPLGDPATDAWLQSVAEDVDADRGRPRADPPVLRARDLAVPEPGARKSSSRHETVGRDLVAGVDLDLHRGEVLAVVGTNGSGKSTLLRALAQVVPARGELRAGRTAMVVQHPEHQFLARTVADEVAWTPRRAGFQGADLDALVSQTLERFGLGHLAERSPYLLSGGEQRRLSLAAVLAHPCDVLLADEPTFGLDRAATAATQRALIQAAEDGAGVVIVTHDLAFAASLADRVLVLHDGHPAALGPTDHILADLDLLARAGLSSPPILERWATLSPRPRARHLVAGLAARVESAIDRAGQVTS